MEILPLTAMFIVRGAHLTENLQHHKSSDVIKILEDKGFAEAKGNDADTSCHFYVQPGQKENSRRTVIVFGDQGFVLPEEGVKFYSTPGSSGE